MRRRRFFGTLVGGAVALPAALRAQVPTLPTIGFFNSASASTFGHVVAGFRAGLAEAGFVDGRNVTVEYRWAEGNYARLPEIASELVARNVAVLVATGGENAALAAKAATSTIPIVFAIGGEPVALGLVGSLSRPGGNLTGLTQFTSPLGGKRMGLLLEMVPGANTIFVLANPTFANTPAQLAEIGDAARRAGLRIVVVEARSESDFEPAFASLVQQRARALLLSSDPFFNSRRDRIVALANRHRIPTIYEFREFATAGGLLSYGANLADGYRQVGAYTGRVLNGAKPAELPVLQPTRFELVVNLRTARQLGVTVPRSMLLRADDVIE